MDTLSKQKTSEFFTTPGGYELLCQKWSALMNTPNGEKLGPEHHLLYLALRGKDWRRAFTPISSERKLRNGAFYNWGLHRALRRIHNEAGTEKLLRPFCGSVDANALEKVRRYLPKSARSFTVEAAYEMPYEE